MNPPSPISNASLAMTSPGRSKTKAQELERIRQNQQRSRERKRVYVAELERKVAQLAEQVEQGQSTTICPNNDAPTVEALARVMCENNARRDLLSALGISASAQEIFIRAFAIRSTPSTTDATAVLQGGSVSDQRKPLDVNLHTAAVASTPTVMDSAALRQTSIDDEWSSDTLRYLHRYRDSHSLPNVSSPLEPYFDQDHHASSSMAGQLTDTALQNNASATSKFPKSLQDPRQMASTPSTQATSAQTFTDISTSLFEGPASLEFSTTYDFAQPLSTALSFPSIESLSRPTVCSPPGTLRSIHPYDGFCVWNTIMRVNDDDSDRTTSCSIALSMIVQHNTQGLSSRELNFRLKAGYRRAEVPNEDCRILNRVLFSVLAEIT